MNSLFVYGTLMKASQLRAVVGAGTYTGVQVAKLEGFKRVQVRGAWYPAIYPEDDSCVSGFLVSGLDDKAMENLDTYEGGQYDRCAVQVEDLKGEHIPCEVYAFKEECYDRLTEAEWVA